MVNCNKLFVVTFCQNTTVNCATEIKCFKNKELAQKFINAWLNHQLVWWQNVPVIGESLTDKHFVYTIKRNKANNIIINVNKPGQALSYIKLNTLLELPLSKTQN